MTDKEALHSEIVSLLAEHLSINDASGPVIRNESPGWDSIRHLTICFALEDRYKIDLTREEMVKMDSSQEIAQVVSAKTGN